MLFNTFGCVGQAVLNCPFLDAVFWCEWNVQIYVVRELERNEH